MKKRSTSPDGSKVERRKSHRFPVAVPIEASWRGPDGLAVKEEAVARQVNAHGGLLEMANYPEIGSRVTLTNFLSAEMAEARVLATPYSREGVSQGIIVELIVPSESFWGVNLQIRKTSVELQKLEDSLRSEGIDLRHLKEFRDAVEYLRTASAVVQQLRECQLHGWDDGEAHSLLVAERVRRGTSLCLEVLADLDAGRLTNEIKGVDEFYHSLEQVHDRLKDRFKRRELERYFAART
ncbi:MAG: hypothetical protein ACRD50_10830 [Candidatus Acidiferrales bacterium]